MSLDKRRFAWVFQASLALGIAGIVMLPALSVAARGQAGDTQGRGQAQTQGQGQAQGQRGGAGGRANQPARDQAASQPVVGTGSITGAVVVDGSGSPVRRARVTLSGGGLRAGQSVNSNDQGLFSFVALPAGRYTLNASKSGYVTVPYGAKRPGRPGTAIQLADGQKLEKLNISIPKGSVMQGIVVDENGEASAGTPVRAMRFVMRTGEKTLEQSGSATTDDRGMYRIWGLQPGDYIVSAAPRNQNFGDIAQTIASEIQSLTQQLRGGGPGGAGPGGGGAGGRGGGGGGRAGALNDPNNLLSGRGQNQLDRLQGLQQLAAAQQPQTPVAYAPVYYPGTTMSSSAGTVTLGIGEERSGVDFQLQLVQTATVSGTISSADGTGMRRPQVSLVPVNQGTMPPIPGANGNNAPVQPDGKFTFTGVAPGQYQVMARMVVPSTEAAADPNANQQGRGGRGGGPGGQGGRGGAPPSQILWGAADVTVNGQDMNDVTITLQPGMSITGRITFEGSILAPPTDLTRVRVSLQPRGQQPFDLGPVPPAQVDASGRFTINGVSPGRYVLQANAPANDVPGGRGGGAAQAGAAAGGRAQGVGQAGAAAPAAQWVLKSAMVGSRDALDFPFDVQPNGQVSGVMLTFSDRTQELSGTLQDATGKPTSDFTIIVFPADNTYWVPQSRRIQSARPDTSGKFTIHGLPAGNYRLTAVTDVETGEWFDPNFLNQLMGPSLTISLGPGERKTQDLRVAGGQ